MSAHVWPYRRSVYTTEYSSFTWDICIIPILQSRNILISVLTCWWEDLRIWPMVYLRPWHMWLIDRVMDFIDQQCSSSRFVNKESRSCIENLGRSSSQTALEGLFWSSFANCCIHIEAQFIVEAPPRIILCCVLHPPSWGLLSSAPNTTRPLGPDLGGCAFWNWEQQESRIWERIVENFDKLFIYFLLKLQEEMLSFEKNILSSTMWECIQWALSWCFVPTPFCIASTCARVCHSVVPSYVTP